MSVTSDEKKIYLKHPNGASAEIYLYGSTVTSWKTADGTERLFVSKKAVLDGSKAIRGGIPICFPIFGPPPAADVAPSEYHAKLPQHGFARTSVWKYAGEVEGEPVGARLMLDPTEETNKIFPIPFGLVYTVVLGEDTLTTSLNVTNPPTSGSKLAFQTLLHTYLAVPDYLKAGVDGLEGKSYKDKTRGGQTFTEDRKIVTVESETDRVYSSLPQNGHLLVPYSTSDSSAGGIKVATTGFPDATIWNPGAKTGSGMADMEDKGWEKYVCVEPGYVSEFKELEKGEGAVFVQTFSLL